jgi:hypothetical protein
MNEYNEMGTGGKSGDDFRIKGKVDKKAPSYKDTYNPNSTVPKLPQIKGAE